MIKDDLKIFPFINVMNLSPFLLLKYDEYIKLGGNLEYLYLSIQDIMP